MQQQGNGVPPAIQVAHPVLQAQVQQLQQTIRDLQQTIRDQQQTINDLRAELQQERQKVKLATLVQKLLLFWVAIFLPPLAVYLNFGHLTPYAFNASRYMWWFWLPGIIYAWYVILTKGWI